MSIIVRLSFLAYFLGLDCDMIKIVVNDLRLYFMKTNNIELSKAKRITIVISAVCSVLVFYLATIYQPSFLILMILISLSVALSIVVLYVYIKREVIPSCIVMLTFTLIWLAIYSLENDFNNGINKLESSGEFNTVKSIALKNFNTNVGLANGRNGFNMTNPYGLSPAMSIMGYDSCYLYINRTRTIIAFKGFFDTNINDSHLIEGIMMHEVGHCLDRKRERNELIGTVIDPNSISPNMRKEQITLQKYEIITDSPELRRWREVFADIFAIGFWKVKYPNEYNILLNNLIKQRGSNKKDTIHNTTCWLDYLKKKAPPKDMSDLMDWADKIRNDAECRLI